MIGSKEVIKAKSILTALVVAGAMAFSSAQAAESGGHEAELQKWSFAGLFGTYDKHQLQRGFQVFREVCANCHSANLIAFRTLAEDGGPEFSEDQVKALAAEYIILDPEAEDGERSAVAADRWPSPFASDQDARDANNGIVPPDFSVLAKARGIHQKFPYWAFNYFTAYQEGGPDYIYNLLVSYEDPPLDYELGEGQAYNSFLGAGFSMLKPLEDEFVIYEGDGEAVPMTVEQYSKDVSAFMMWMADPHLVSRKQMGFRALTFLIVLAGLMYLIKRKVWADIKH